MAPFCNACPSGPRGVTLLIAVCVVLAHGRAMGQSAETPFQDALTPKLQTGPGNLPRFQKFDRAALANLAGSTTFSPAGSGAGATGFDSTNSRKTRAKAKPKATADAQFVAPGAPAEAVVSPYDARADATGSVAAGAPGKPPVELGPIRTFPKKRKAHTEPEDPYVPLGIRAGAFDLFPAVEFIGGHDSDPSREPNGKGAWFYTIAPELRAQSNWSRHELKADLRGSYTGYSPDETPSLSRPYLNGKVDGRVDITHETHVDAGGRILVSTDNPGSPNLQAGLSRLPIFATAGGTIGLGQRFNRFDLSIKGDVERTIYQPSSLTDGTTASNDDRNYDQYTGTVRGSYELSPGLTPFGEFAADSRVHDLDTDSSGFQRDSNGLTGKVGAKFELTRLMTGEAAIGYVQRVYADPRLENIGGLIGDASLIWTASALTTVKLTGRSTVGESTVPGVSGVLYRDVGLQADHAFRRWLVASLKFGFGVDDYVGDGRIDKRFSAGAGLTYKLNRSVQVRGEFRQDWLQSNAPGASYTASVFMLGLRLQR
ncbi:MAG TPA: outer membrane beta-barrel protein [Pseudolabrys sp.]|nr:outer membrane beta-barrel protein [Pseudolabrys sp.]